MSWATGSEAGAGGVNLIASAAIMSHRSLAADRSMGLELTVGRLEGYRFSLRCNQHHSLRSATSGSSCAARRAGT